MDNYLVFKALHIIAVVAWFAGLFYMPRLFVYFAEANLKGEPEKSILQNQFQIMQRRLWYGITWPASIATFTFALFLLPNWELKQNPWLVIKLCLVIGLYLYQLYLHKIFLAHKAGLCPQSSNLLRVINEVATLFLVSIVFLVVLKDSFSFIYGLIGIIAFSAILMFGIKAYKHVRQS